MLIILESIGRDWKFKMKELKGWIKEEIKVIKNIFHFSKKTEEYIFFFVFFVGLFFVVVLVGMFLFPHNSFPWLFDYDGNLIKSIIKGLFYVITFLIVLVFIYLIKGTIIDSEYSTIEIIINLSCSFLITAWIGDKSFGDWLCYIRMYFSHESTEFTALSMRKTNIETQILFNSIFTSIICR